jgi:SAM-dependent methyltransferase
VRGYPSGRIAPGRLAADGLAASRHPPTGTGPAELTFPAAPSMIDRRRRADVPPLRVGVRRPGHDACMTPHTEAAPGHPHGHQHWDWDQRGPDMILHAEASAPMVEQALAWLAGRVPDATRVLDVGSGPGVAACTLAGMLPNADVLAVDGAAPLLALARERADRRGLGERLTTRQVSLPDDLADLPPADLVWVSGVVHHLPDPAAGVRALGALVRPGGILAIAEGGLPIRFLPLGADHGLTARLDAVGEALIARHEHPAGIAVAAQTWPDLLLAAGLQGVQSRSFLLDVPAPLPEAARRYLHSRLTMTQQMLAGELSADDTAALAALLDLDTPTGVLHRADTFLLTATTLHTATAPRKT